jgi:hypothetical protein
VEDKTILLILSTSCRRLAGSITDSHLDQCVGVVDVEASDLSSPQLFSSSSGSQSNMKSLEAEPLSFNFGL